jgi:hypothetical protein
MVRPQLLDTFKLKDYLQLRGCRDVEMLFTVDKDGAVHGLVLFWVPKRTVAREVLSSVKG